MAKFAVVSLAPAEDFAAGGEGQAVLAARIDTDLNKKILLSIQISIMYLKIFSQYISVSLKLWYTTKKEIMK